LTTPELWHVESKTELLAEIGKVTIRWAALDLYLVNILAAALRNQAAAHNLIFNATGAGRQRLETFKEVIGASDFTTEERRVLIVLAKQCGRLLGERNVIVHSPLVTSITLEGKKIKWSMHRVSRSGKRVDVTVDSIRQHADDVGEVLGKIEELSEQLTERYLIAYDPELPQDLFPLVDE